MNSRKRQTKDSPNGGDRSGSGCVKLTLIGFQDDDLEEKVAAAMKKLKEPGLVSPYLRSFVVAHINPLRWIKGESPPLEEVLKTMRERAARQPEVKDVKTYIRHREDTAVTVTSDELPSFKAFAQQSSEPVDAPETIRETNHTGVFLNPKRGAFGGDPKDWSFFRGGDEIITATIKDKEFLRQYDEGDIRLNQADLLTVDVLERQKVKGTIVQKPTYEILRVTRYVKGERQDVLPLYIESSKPSTR